MSMNFKSKTLSALPSNVENATVEGRAYLCQKEGYCFERRSSGAELLGMF